MLCDEMNARVFVTILLAHGRCTAFAVLGTVGNTLMGTLLEESSILGSSILGFLGVAALECDTVALVLETLWGYKALDLGSLGVWLLALTLWLNFTTNNEFADLNHERILSQHFNRICIAAHTLQIRLRLAPQSETQAMRCRSKTHIIILGEAEELADLRGALGTKTLWVHDVCDTWNLRVSLLDDGES